MYQTHSGTGTLGELSRHMGGKRLAAALVAACLLMAKRGTAAPPAGEMRWALYVTFPPAWLDPTPAHLSLGGERPRTSGRANEERGGHWSALGVGLGKAGMTIGGWLPPLTKNVLDIPKSLLHRVTDLLQGGAWLRRCLVACFPDGWPALLRGSFLGDSAGRGRFASGPSASCQATPGIR